MKTKILLFGGFIIAFLTFISACKKDKQPDLTTETEQPQPTVDKSKITQLITNLSTPLETFTINAASTNTFVCNNGTGILINANAFLTNLGALASGIITIEIKDVLSKKDMILNNAIPISNGELLVSGGEIYLNAIQSGQALKLNPLSSITLYVPAIGVSYTNMKVFYSQGPSTLSNTDLNWTTANKPITLSGLGTTFQNYVFGIDSINWINCDFFYNYIGSKTTCTVNLNGSFDNSNTMVLLSLNGETTLVRLTHNSSKTIAVKDFESYTNSIPVGKNYTIVAISFDGTNYYYGSQAVTMTTDMVINMPALTLSSKAGIEANLSTLP